MSPNNYPIISYLLLLIFCFINQNISAQSELQFLGNNLHAIGIEADKNTGLDQIYVLYDTTNVSAIYKARNSTSASTVKWYRFSNLGGGFAEEINGIRTDGNLSIMDNISGNTGYIIEENESRHYFWIVNYLPYRLELKSLNASENSDCESTVLHLEGNASPIHYFTINGQQRVLSRELILKYETQEWDESLKEFYNSTVSKTLESIENNTIRVTPPAYCSTYYTLIGDRFLKEWNWTQEVQSSVVSPVAVAVETEAIQTPDDNTGDSETTGSNQIQVQGTGLGGSAPADIEFRAYTTEGVIHHEWQMSVDPDFENVDFRFNEQNLNYTFNEEGTYYLRYIGSNFDGSCEDIGETYTVSIGASELRCPNAFSPDGDGVNDEWKVSYRSIIDFDCWIFDRNGHEIIHLDSPDKGWDGKRNGKPVGPGVYFYVINAKGADGKNYKKSGDINIIRHRSFTNQGNDTETE